jgi:hypothetical protein
MAPLLRTDRREDTSRWIYAVSNDFKGSLSGEQAAAFWEFEIPWPRLPNDADELCSPTWFLSAHVSILMSVIDVHATFYPGPAMAAILFSLVPCSSIWSRSDPASWITSTQQSPETASSSRPAVACKCPDSDTTAFPLLTHIPRNQPLLPQPGVNNVVQESRQAHRLEPLRSHPSPWHSSRRPEIRHVKAPGNRTIKLTARVRGPNDRQSASKRTAQRLLPSPSHLLSELLVLRQMP